MASQVTVFVENRPGRLSKVTRVLADNDINIRAITISDMGEYGLINIITTDPDRAEKVLGDKGFTVTRKQVVGVLMEDKPGALANIAEFLNSKEINVSNAYGFILKEGTRAVMILEVEDFNTVEKVLKKGGFHTLTKDELHNL
ncbi:MAG TPA: ACT domain-containing protein [Spirochaetota bacterium]|nr:ACT domain-containing protein [Spirochaetota bacterium]